MEASKARKVRYAVVGLGDIAQGAALPAFEHAGENSELVALVSSDAEKLHALAERYGAKLTGSYEDLERVIDEGSVDAVYVTVPSSLHREMTERAARAGAHVLCEKPMATTVADCEAMIQACDDHRVKLMIAYHLHHEDADLEAIAREIGEPRLFSSVFSQQVRVRDVPTRGDLGGGALFDLGIYCVHAARHVFDAEPLAVTAMQTVGAAERYRHVDETTSAILHFPNDRIAIFVACKGAASVSQFRVVGEKGGIELDPAYGHERPVWSDLSDFSRCLLEDAPPEPSGLEGLADLRVIEAIVRSAATREVVQLPPLERAPHPSLEVRTPPREPVPEPGTVHAPSPAR